MTCPECGSDELTWSVATNNHSGVADGRLSLRDISAYLLLGCEECSATVRLIDADSGAGLILLERLGLDDIPAAGTRGVLTTEPL